MIQGVGSIVFTASVLVFRVRGAWEVAGAFVWLFGFVDLPMKSPQPLTLQAIRASSIDHLTSMFQLLGP